MAGGWTGTVPVLGIGIYTMKGFVSGDIFGPCWAEGQVYHPEFKQGQEYLPGYLEGEVYSPEFKQGEVIC